MVTNPTADEREALRAIEEVPDDPHYSIELVWDPDDRIYVASVPELQGCVTHGGTAYEAVRNAEEAIASWLGAARRFGDPIPPPTVVRFAAGLAEGEREGPF